MQTKTIEGFRLSPQQKQFWLLQQDSQVYQAYCAIQIQGNLNVEHLKEALERIVNRHEIFRTRFHRHPGIKLPIQVIETSGTLAWTHVKLNGLSPQDQSAHIQQRLQEKRDLNIPSQLEFIVSASLLTLSENHHILLVILPALCADSWTLKNLVKEISQTYKACLQGEDVSEAEPVQYLQFSEWQNEIIEDEDAATGQAYWREQNVQTITLPFEAESLNSIPFEPDVYRVKINPGVAAKIAALAHRSNVTPAEVLFACWYALLWQLTKQSEITVNTVYSGRSYEELHEVMGLLAKWLPVHCSFKNNLKFSELLSNLGEKLGEIDPWQDYFIGQESTDTDRDTNVPISFEFDDWSDQYYGGDVSFSIEQKSVCFERFKLKLRCVRKQESIIAEFHYDRQRFDPDVIQCFAEQFQTGVEQAVNNPEMVVSELNYISDRTRHHLLVELNDTQTHYPQTHCIHHLFEQQVERTPDNIALVWENQQLTYTELNRRTNQLAHYLQRQGVGAEVVVGIYAERSIHSIIAMLAILKAGGAYLPLDSALPPDPLAFRLQDAKVPILLTQKKLLKHQDTQVLTLVYLDADWQTIAQESDANPTNTVTPETLAYVLYTSGSTGEPKGVAIEHRQILNYLYAISEKLDVPAGVSFATVSTFGADLGNTAIFPALCTGGCLHILSQERASDPEALAEYVQHHPIDCLKIVPSHLATLLASSPSASILPRQCLILGGEAVTWELVAKIQEAAPNCRILNHYGPTETTVGVLTYPVQSQGNRYHAKTVPIGRAIANTQVYLLDEQLQPLPIGVPGELYIGGAGVARGYLNRPELTAQTFITVKHLGGQNVHSTRLYKTGDKARYLPDGTIEFLGRVDYQVKIRGFRIELGEIEGVLTQHPSVQQVVVWLSEDELGSQRLVAYVIPNPKQTPNISELRQFCLNQLPEYMVPSVFVLLKSLPLTPNGKIDRRALPAPEQTRPELEGVYVAPRTPVEKQLAEIWAQVLGIEKIGIHDNFFDLGGHSLLITQLLAQVRETFQVNLSLRSLFQQPTVANIAQKIAQIAKLGTQVEQDTINLNAEAVLDPTIRPNGIPYNPDTVPTAIFLTGATGFLGAFLLYELLQQTQANIYCLVRAETLESGKTKIQQRLESYLLWDQSFNSRIIPILGDLAQPLLGLTPAQFERLASKLDAIYHNGAVVNFTYPYSVLKAPNVLGTQEVLRLACQVKVKPVHVISTISVVYPNNPDVEVVREQDSLDYAKMPSSGYAQSKWVAEKLATIARERGLPVCIYRPGRISGHSKTGACNPGDHTYRMIKGCIQLGGIPNQDIQLNLSPVDYVSQAIVFLSRQKDSIGKAFHLVNPQPLPLKEMVSYIRSLGYSIELVAYEQWRKQLINSVDSPENALYPLMTIFAEETSNSQSQQSPVQQFDCQNTLTGLGGTSIVCPPVDAEVFKSYFSYLIQTGFLNPPLLQFHHYQN